MAYEGRGHHDPVQPQIYGFPPHQQQFDQPPYEPSQPPSDSRYQYAPPPYPPGYGENQATPIPPPPGYRHQSPPHLFDAVNQAADKVEPVRPPEATAAQLPPDVLERLTTQITETVKNQILNDLKASLPQAQQPQAPPPPPTYQPQSPLTPSSRPVYTPESHDADASDESDEEEIEAPSRPPPRKESPEVVRKEDLAGRLGDRSVQPEERSRSRPAIPRMMTNDEVTTLEKIWQPLFTNDGQPTTRLSQFLRGLALHLVEDYEPQKSLVIPPHKMQRFYDEVGIENEPYPWRDLFTKLPHATLSRIYRSLGCAHHFIQSNVRNEPTVPALTPEGFCTWLTLLIQAHPDSEFSRLACAVRDMPISNADDRKERLPKELSRRLFPKHFDSKIRERCNVALNPPPTQTYASGPSNGPSNNPPTGPPMGTAPRDIPERPREHSIPASVASAPAVGSFPERERAPYGSTASNADRNSRIENLRLGSDATDGGPASVVSDSAAYPGTSPLERVTSIPIERERKPYIAKEGRGKVYEAGASNTATSSNATLRPEHTPLNIEEEAKRSRRRSNSQAASMQPPFPSARASVPPLSGLSAGLGRSDTRRNRSPSNSVSSNGFVPPSGPGSQIYSGSEDDSQARDARRRERDRETEDERRERKERERRREKEKEREREEEDEERRERRKEKEREERKERERDRDRDKSRRREKERDSDDEFYERRGEREREREREKEQERRKKEDEKLERDRERDAAEYRRAAEERERYEDDARSAYSEPPPHHHNRRPTNPGSNGYGPVPSQYAPQAPLGGASQRGGY